MSSYNPEESLSDGTNVDNNENYIPIQWILLCVFFPAYTLLLFYSRTCTNKVKNSPRAIVNTTMEYTQFLSPLKNIGMHCLCFVNILQVILLFLSY